MEKKIKAIKDIYQINSMLFNNKGEIILKSEGIKKDNHFKWIKKYKDLDLNQINIVIDKTRIGAVIIPLNEQYLILGNVFLGEKNERRVWAILDGNKHFTEKEMKYFKQLPEISLSEFKRVIRLISRWLGNDELEIVITQQHYTNKKVTLTDREEYGLLENYRLSIKMMDCIKNGQPDILSEIMQYEIFYENKYSLRDHKNNFIRLSSLVSTAAFDGGLGLYEIDALTKEFTSQIETCNDEQKIHELQKDMLMSVAEAVKQVQHITLNHPLNRKIQQYVQLHLHEKIDYQKMAEDLDISKNYMQTVFKKEANKSLNDYIHEKKINEAIFLINQDEMSMAEIGAYLGFSSASYFGHWFKQITGMTPKKYKTKK